MAAGSAVVVAVEAEEAGRGGDTVSSRRRRTGWRRCSAWPSHLVYLLLLLLLLSVVPFVSSGSKSAEQTGGKDRIVPTVKATLPDELVDKVASPTQQYLVRTEQYLSHKKSTELANTEPASSKALPRQPPSSTPIAKVAASPTATETHARTTRQTRATSSGRHNEHDTQTGPTTSGDSDVMYTSSATSRQTVEINGTEYTIVDDPEPYYDEHGLLASSSSSSELLSRTKRGKKRKKDRYIKEPHRRQSLDNYSNEYKIKRMLLRDQYYDKTTRPVRNDSTTTTLYVGMSLYHILDTNEKYQTLKALIAVRLRWVDEFLRWDPAKYGGVDNVWVPAMDIWKPDIFINNFADDSFQDFMDTFTIVNSNGSVLWMFPAVVTTYCTLDVRHFPFDRQKCKIIFISWTFHGFKLNVTYNESEHNTVYYTPKNQEWYVDQIGVNRHEKIYACCVEPYPDVTFTIHMTRRSLFYIINLIFPCLLIYAVSFLGFFLPVESGEKVNLEITILLALVVFLLIVGETLPPTPDAIPALGVLFGTTMLMVSIALVMAVIVTNIFLRKDSGHRVPICLRKIFIGKSSRTSLSNKVTHTENHVLEAKIQEIEIDNLSNQSEAETLTCRSRCGRKKGSSTGTPYKAAAGDMDLHVRMSHEWQILAKCVDRMFFWLFLAASVAALTSMFLQVPAYNAT